MNAELIGRDQVMVVPSRFSSGLMLPTDAVPLARPAMQTEAAHSVTS
ncbi:Hypothetical protein SCLAV_2585 [Streptomyces clavuligerus]|uniref:Uncharacterized protein n=1 Tax=Streptomyces clavuligerus TaxID=1901 RepID=B5GY26_STRCL|nr:hypothetical protein SSCG_04306 [Streptomyces clavuligerus]EFG07657.1 Hypothetical protein SCLAV_2585 [Streptomyces clavuligerus]